MSKENVQIPWVEKYRPKSIKEMALPIAKVGRQKVNIAEVSSTDHDDHTTSLYFTLETKGLTQLSRLLVKIEEVRGVISVARVGGETSIKVKPTA